ncbi:hypothetical protein [Streptomyces zagrosensis]|uniref:Uncharacterized protein n=1 Tax=Streptomyces zagrosensis TaxID=1042984 RepID=A0A7W9Q8D1_9ACTN|nr:hypothetical protein [Streptomyces zagrosensis]MBB5935498.1 hypothetical protein [Streptomyces zagrosensis]
MSPRATMVFGRVIEVWERECEPLGFLGGRFSTITDRGHQPAHWLCCTRGRSGQWDACVRDDSGRCAKPLSWAYSATYQVRPRVGRYDRPHMGDGLG